MISREQMEPDRRDYLARPVATQLEQIALTLDRIAAALRDAASSEEARDEVDRTMAYTEWTAHALDGTPMIKPVVDCHRLMGRLRSDWGKVLASPELREWIRRDVAEMRDRVWHTARAAA
jgi:hypothetical protein